MATTATSTAWASSSDEYFAKAEGLRAQWQGHDLIGVALAPHAPYTVCDANFERVALAAARWVTCAEKGHLSEFTRANQARLAHDVDGNLVYLADTRVNLQLTQERWPKVQFHSTREHGQRL